MATDPMREEASRLIPMAVGALVIQFALLEHWIDGMVATIFMYVDGARSIRRQYPFNAKEEVNFLNDCFGQLPPLKRYKQRGWRFLEKLKPLAEMRHNVVHGHLRTIDYASGTLEFSRVFKGKNGQPIRRTLTILASELVDQQHEIHMLNPVAMDLCHRLVDEFGPEKKV
jgi:hypothetical protein